MQILSADQLRENAAKLKRTATVEIEELGGSLELKRLSPQQMVELAALADDQVESMRHVVAWSCEAIGGIDGLDQLDLPFGLLAQIFEAAAELNGLSNEATRAKAKN